MLHRGVADDPVLAQQVGEGRIAHLAGWRDCLVVGLLQPLGGWSGALSGCAHGASSPAPLTLPGVALQPGKAATGSPDVLKYYHNPDGTHSNWLAGHGMTALKMQWTRDSCLELNGLSGEAGRRPRDRVSRLRPSGSMGETCTPKQPCREHVRLKSGRCAEQQRCWPVRGMKAGPCGHTLHSSLAKWTPHGIGFSQAHLRL